MKTLFRVEICAAFCLVVILSAVASAQSTGFVPPKLDPVPASYTIAEQADSPVRIAYVGIQIYSPENKMLSYSLTNAGTKDIKSVIVRYTRGGGSDTMLLGLPSSPTGGGYAPFIGVGASSQFLFLYPKPKTFEFEKAADKIEDSLEFKADFVLFQDGTSWGPDSAGHADYLLGIYDGHKRFVAEVKKLVGTKDEAALKALIMTDGGPPDLRPAKDETQKQAGTRRGYGVAMLVFRSDLLGRGDLSGVPARIRDIERDVGFGSPVDDKQKQVGVSWGFNLPIRITGFAIGGRSIKVDERFSAQGDWLADMVLKIQNNSGKTIKAVNGTMDYPETHKTGGMMSSNVRYGRNPDRNIPTATDNDPHVEPGKTFEFKIFRERPATSGLLKKYPGLEGISRAVIEIYSIDFDDGTRWSGGQWRKQDPENPKRWIPVK